MTTMRATWYDSVGHEIYQLQELRNRLDSNTEPQAIWAIESLIEAIDIATNRSRCLPNEYHPEANNE